MVGWEEPDAPLALMQGQHMDLPHCPGHMAVEATNGMIPLMDCTVQVVGASACKQTTCSPSQVQWMLADMLAK